MATIPNSTTFYVYALARPVKRDWRIFYVGKGSKRRVFDHENEARKGHKCHKCNIIRKVLREGDEIQRYILLTTGDEQEAFDYEREMIALHGRENLCNLTDGGDGISGYKASDASKKKSSAYRKQLYTNAEARKKAGNGSRRVWQDPQRREELSAKIAERARTIENRARQGRVTKARWLNPACRAKSVAAIRAAQTPEVSAKRSQKAKERYADPSAREKTAQALKVAKSTPEAKAEQSERSKAMWASPGHREKMKNAPRRIVTPEERQAMIAKMTIARRKRSGLTRAQGEEICRLFATGTYLQKDLMTMFHISDTLIRKVLRGTQIAWRPDATDLPQDQ